MGRVMDELLQRGAVVTKFPKVSVTTNCDSTSSAVPPSEAGPADHAPTRASTKHRPAKVLGLSLDMTALLSAGINKPSDQLPDTAQSWDNESTLHDPTEEVQRWGTARGKREHILYLMKITNRTEEQVQHLVQENAALKHEIRDREVHRHRTQASWWTMLAEVSRMKTELVLLRGMSARRATMFKLIAA